MNRGCLVRWVFCLALSLMGGAHAPAQAGQLDQARVIVKLKPNASVLQSSVVQAQALSKMKPMQRLGLHRGLALDDGRQVALHVHVAMASGISSQALAAQLAKDADVVYAVPDGWRHVASVPTDPLYSATGNLYVGKGQWYMHANGGEVAAAINVLPVWSVTGGSGVAVAVLDTGVRFDHPDLIDKLESGYNMVSDPIRAGNGLGRTGDASDLGDWLTDTDISTNPSVYNASDCIVANSKWHGTEVAGVIGASSNNGMGMASIAPGSRLLPVRVLGKCGGWDSDIIAGMYWAAQLPVPNVSSTAPLAAKVLNLSLGGSGACSQAYKDVLSALTAQRVVVVASAGNDAGLAVSTPGNCPGVITVAGLRHVGTKVGYSSVGPEVSISAPGGNCVNADDTGPCLYPILSATNTGRQSPIPDNLDGSTYSDESVAGRALGTSFAAPQVSAAVALMLEARPALTPAAVAALLHRTARTFPSSGADQAVRTCEAPSTAEQLECYCTQQTCGAGMLDVSAAVLAARGDAIAVVQASTDAPVVGTQFVLSGAASMSSPGATAIRSYLFEIVDSGGIVSTLTDVGRADAKGVTATGTGFFKVRLTIEDNLDHVATIDQWIHVPSEAAAPVNNNNRQPSGGGGGGAADGLLLAGLLCALVAVALNRQGSRVARLKA